VNEVTLRDAEVHFGKVHALRGVEVSARSGQVVMLAGPNGAGKSTLLRVLLGLIRPKSGQLLVDGVRTPIDNDFKRRLAYLPEAVAFAENLTGRQVLRFFASARGVPRKRIDAVLKRVGLWDARRRTVRGYSRGMRQRLGLAIAILPETKFLILDEPTGGLDQEGLNVLWSVLEEWQTAGRMVILSSHDLTLLERRVDVICLMQDGRVIASDSPPRLRHLAALPVRVSFTLNGNPEQVEGLSQAIASWDRSAQVSRGDGQLSVHVAPEALLSLMDLRAGYPEAVSQLRVEEPGLDLVYEALLASAGGA
jgi:Cu-processing system ATP-binding protein